MITEGIDGKTPGYQERLWPSIGQWSFVLIMTVSLGIAYGRAYGPNLGAVVGLVTTALVVAGLIANSPLIQIDELNFRVGRARLPLQFVGKVQKLDEMQSRRARSTDANPNAYFQLRGGIKPTVIVEVTDPQDPHPYWQVSTRNPDLLITTLIEFKNAETA